MNCLCCVMAPISASVPRITNASPRFRGPWRRTGARKRQPNAGLELQRTLSLPQGFHSSYHPTARSILSMVEGLSGSRRGDASTSSACKAATTEDGLARACLTACSSVRIVPVTGRLVGARLQGLRSPTQRNQVHGCPADISAAGWACTLGTMHVLRRS